PEVDACVDVAERVQVGAELVHHGTNRVRILNCSVSNYYCVIRTHAQPPPERVSNIIHGGLEEISGVRIDKITARFFPSSPRSPRRGVCAIGDCQDDETPDTSRMRIIASSCPIISFMKPLTLPVALLLLSVSLTAAAAPMSQDIPLQKPKLLRDRDIEESN